MLHKQKLSHFDSSQEGINDSKLVEEFYCLLVFDVVNQIGCLCFNLVGLNWLNMHAELHKMAQNFKEQLSVLFWLVENFVVVKDEASVRKKHIDVGSWKSWLHEAGFQINIYWILLIQA